jgi:hypothetical protein
VVARARPVGFAGPVSTPASTGTYNVKDIPYGAAGDGVQDDTAAIQAAIAAANAAGGGEVVFPVGTYVCAAPLDLKGMARVTLRGVGNPSHLGGAAVLRFTGTTGPFIALASSFAVWIERLRVEYTNAAFTGDVAAYGHYNGGVAPNGDPAYGGFRDCVFQGSATAFGARSGINPALGIILTFERCRFSYCGYGILGRTVNTDYSIVMTIDQCTFVNCVNAGIGNPGDNWTIRNCTFEQRADNKVGAIWTDTTIRSAALKIDNIWIGDASVNGGVALRVNALGLTIINSYLSASGNGATGDKLIQIHNGFVADGITIVGNNMLSAQYGIDWDNAAHRGYFVSGNYFNLTTPQVNGGSLGSGTVLSNDGPADAVATAGLTVTGPATVTGALTASSTLAVTGAATLSGAVTAGTSLLINGAGAGTALKRVQSSGSTVDPPSIAANSKGSVTVTVTGAAVGDHFVCEPPGALEAGLIYVGCRVTGADQLTIYLANITAGAIDGAARSWDWTWFDFT